MGSTLDRALRLNTRRTGFGRASMNFPFGIRYFAVEDTKESAVLNCLFSRWLIGLFLLTAGSLSVANPVWPSAPVHIVVPFPPGGSNDVIARRLGERLSKAFGQPVVIENKGGGAGSIGAQAVAISAADGYTFLFVSSSLATASAVQKTPYDPATSFSAVARVARAPFIILTRQGFGPKTVAELIAYGKANPGKINYGSAGPGDTTQMATELFNETVGIQMTAVPYKGIAPAQLDLIAGRLDLIVTTMASVKGTAADQLPKLAFTGEAREPDMPQIPTVAELGIPYAVDVWWGVFAPAALPIAIRDKMNRAINEILVEPDFVAFLKNAGATAAPTTPAVFQEILVKDVERWKIMAKRAGVQ